MKITKDIQQTVTVISDILCNKCGESCCTDSGSVTFGPQFDGLIEVEARGGYWSRVIGDMNCYKFSLCETCLVEFTKTFKIDAFYDPDAEFVRAEDTDVDLVGDSVDDPLDDDLYFSGSSSTLIKPEDVTEEERVRMDELRARFTAIFEKKRLNGENNG